jgi:hypothetical protein
MKQPWREVELEERRTSRRVQIWPLHVPHPHRSRRVQIWNWGLHSLAKIAGEGTATPHEAICSNNWLSWGNGPCGGDAAGERTVGRRERERENGRRERDAPVGLLVAEREERPADFRRERERGRERRLRDGPKIFERRRRMRERERERERRILIRLF